MLRLLETLPGSWLQYLNHLSRFSQSLPGFSRALIYCASRSLKTWFLIRTFVRNCYWFILHYLYNFLVCQELFPGSRRHWFKHLLRFSNIQSKIQSVLVVFYCLQYNEEYLNMPRSLKLCLVPDCFYLNIFSLVFLELCMCPLGVNSLRCPISRKRAF